MAGKFLRKQAKLKRMNPPGENPSGTLPDESIPHNPVSDPGEGLPEMQDAAGPAMPPPGMEEAPPMQPETPAPQQDVTGELSKLIRQSAGSRIQGQASPTEPFSAYRQRALSQVRALMAKLADSPQQSIAILVPAQIIRLVKAWIAEGTPDDLRVSPDAFLKTAPDKPGAVERFAPDATGQWTLVPFDPVKAPELPGGSIFLVQTGADAKSTQASLGQSARAQMVKHIQKGDYGRARAVGLKAVQSGLMSDQDAEEAVDEGLPDDGEDLPSSALLASASAASPAKRQRLSPALQNRFGDLSALPPHAQKAIQDHLQGLR
jgi:hypothetical protein